MCARRADRSTSGAQPSGNTAVAFYRKIRALAPRRTDLVFNDIAKYANRAVSVSDEERRAILVDLARLVAGEIACPNCDHAGPHRSNGHHRVGRIRLYCSRCSTEFGVRDMR